MRRSFFTKYFTGLLLILLLSLISVGIFSTWAITQFRTEDTTARQKDYALLLLGMIPAEGFSDKEEALDFVLKAEEAENIRLTIVDPSGMVLADSEALSEELDNHNSRPEIRIARIKGIGNATRYSNTLKEMYQYTAVLHRPSKQILRISLAIGNIQKEANRSYLRVLIVTLLVFTISLGISFTQAQNISRMLNSIRITTEHYASGDFSRSLILSGFKEATELSTSINAMGKQLKERLNQIISEKEKSQTMLNHLNEPVLSLSPSLIIQEANRAALAMAGLELDQCKGKNLIQIFRNIQLCEIAENALAFGKVQHKLIFWKEEGKYLHVHVGLIQREEDESSLLLMVMNDVTEIKNLELMRKDFVGNVSHELRTPVTSILGFADTLLLNRDLDKDKQREFIKIIRKQGNRLSMIIDDLLMLSALEEEDSKLSKKILSAKKLVNGALRICQHKAEESGIHVLKNFCPHDAFKGHRNLTEQALVNFIDNAIKYSPRGSLIEISTELKESQLFFHVKDNGPGIPADQQGRIFERFYRIDKARSREVGGTGLGLSIVKHIAQKHGGEIGLKSEAGKGCDFFISFPVA